MNTFESLENIYNGNETIQMSGSLMIDYIFLDSEERKRFAENAHDYLIEQVQFNGKNSLAASQNMANVDLVFNHPVKEIFWVVQNEYFDNDQQARGLLENGAGNSGNHIFDFSFIF